MANRAYLSLLLSFALTACHGCGARPHPHEGTPNPPTQQLSRWRYSTPQEAQEHQAIETAAQAAEPCSPNFRPACSDNGDWFNCRCENEAGAVDPARDWWSQIARDKSLRGRLWQYHLENAPQWSTARAAQWQRVQADAQQRAPNFRASVLRITAQGPHEEWLLILHQDSVTASLYYNETGQFVREQRETFHPD